MNAEAASEAANGAKNLAAETQNLAAQAHANAEAAANAAQANSEAAANAAQNNANAAAEASNRSEQMARTANLNAQASGDSATEAQEMARGAREAMIAACAEASSSETRINEKLTKQAEAMLEALAWSAEQVSSSATLATGAADAIQDMLSRLREIEGGEETVLGSLAARLGRLADEFGNRAGYTRTIADQSLMALEGIQSALSEAMQHSNLIDLSPEATTEPQDAEEQHPTEELQPRPRTQSCRYFGGPWINK
uniref:Uncharacterized protein n=1 Tax=Leersia perrieri TaxID=77586 RepID=A0A0D9VW42_9ORYZ